MKIYHNKNSISFTHPLINRHSTKDKISQLVKNFSNYEITLKLYNINRTINGLKTNRSYYPYLIYKTSGQRGKNIIFILKISLDTDKHCLNRLRFHMLSLEGEIKVKVSKRRCSHNMGIRVVTNIFTYLYVYCTNCRRIIFDMYVLKFQF